MPSRHDGLPGATRQWTEEPFGIVRLILGTLALLGTCIAVGLAVVTRDVRMLELVAALWAVYGLTMSFLSGVMDPVIDGFFNLMANAGLTRAGSGYSAMETLVARGHYQTAADSYAEAARNSADRVEATLRRAVLLAGPLAQPETAAVELDNLRQAKLSSRDDFRVGLALIDLYEHQLRDPGRAMGELRRLIDRYPTAHAARRLRSALGELKAQRSAETPTQ
jgi:tetratricopeptide (TPR) repeat protein